MSLGVRVTEEPPNAQVKSAFVHPASANGAFLQLIEVAPGVNPWPAAGPDWQAVEGQPVTRQLRQVAVLVRDLDQAIEHWGRMFGLQTTKRFQVSFTGLEIAVLPLASKDTFIELAQPTGPGAPSQRFLERYGEGLYLTIYEIGDIVDGGGPPAGAGRPVHHFPAEQPTIPTWDSTASGCIRAVCWGPSLSFPKCCRQKILGRPPATPGSAAPSSWKRG